MAGKRKPEGDQATEKSGKQKRPRATEAKKGPPSWKQPPPAEPQVDPAAGGGGGDASDSEIEALNALRLVTTALTADVAANGAVSSTTPAAPGTHEGRTWRAGLEVLKRERPIVREHVEKYTPEEVLAFVRKSIDNGDWTKLMVGRAPGPSCLKHVVRGLDAGEAAQTFKAFSEKYQSAPHVMLLTDAWIKQFLEERAEAVVDHSLGNAALRQLLRVLEQRLAGDPCLEAQACHGKWRLMSELGGQRRATVEERQAEAAQPAATSAQDAGGASSSEEEEEGDDAEGGDGGAGSE